MDLMDHVVFYLWLAAVLTLMILALRTTIKNRREIKRIIEEEKLAEEIFGIFEDID